MPFEFRPTPLPGLLVVEPMVRVDARGWFMEAFRASEFRAAGVELPFVQENLSYSGRGSLRGMHFQRGPRAQGKLVRAVAGRVWDVAVDLRPESPTFGRWHGLELSTANRLACWIPPGFAHGFLALEDGTELLYACTAEYDPASEAGFRWDDPEAYIAWPETPVRVSPRDAALPLLRDLPESAARRAVVLAGTAARGGSSEGSAPA